MTRLAVLEKAVSAFLLASFALAAALVIQLLALKWRGPIAWSRLYPGYVSEATDALLQILFPGILWGIVVVAVRYLALGPSVPDRRFVHRAVSLAAFYLGGALIARVWGVSGELPPWIWGLAWLIAVLAIWASEVQRGDLSLRIVAAKPAPILVDGGVVALATTAAYLVRFDGDLNDWYQQQLLFVLPYFVLFQLLVNFLWRVYSLIWSFTGLREVLVIAQAVATQALIGILLRIFLLEGDPLLRVPFGILLIQPVLAFFGFLGVRGLRRLIYLHRRTRPRLPRKRLLLLGAGSAAHSLLREVVRGRTFEPVGLVDDDPAKLGQRIHGIQVLGTTAQLETLLLELEVDEVVLCFPSAPRSKVREVVAVCQRLSVPASTVPSLEEIVTGKVAISSIRKVGMEELLGRPLIQYSFDSPAVLDAFQGRRLLVTGAAGSIGSELVRQLLSLGPEQLVLLDQDENGLYEIWLEIRDAPVPTAELVADIRDRQRLDRILQRFRPEVIFHAAAYKHVPLMEHHPGEAILNNVVGSKNLIELASLHGCRSFVLVSTDKAVNPTNVMGASKRVAEMVLQCEAASGTATRFCGVRFGNVLGSRASVVPLFQRQIAEGKDITVTHPDVTRYFMTIPEAVQLVIQAGSLGRHGEIFVLDMGDPVKIVDLATDLIRLSGLEPGRDVRIRYTGLRPGEKLYEELLIHQENGMRTTTHPKIFVAQAIPRSSSQLKAQVEALERAACSEDAERILELLQSMQIGYRPNPEAGEAEETLSPEPLPQVIQGAS